MSLGAVRPRFHHDVTDPVEAAIARIVQETAATDGRCVCRVLGHHADITLARESRQWFTPCVQLEFRPYETGGTRVEGLVGPHPNLWTFYAFVNFNLIVLATFGSILGLVQRSLDESAWALWAVPIGVTMLAGMYLVSQFGRRLAVEQTRELMLVVHAGLAPR